MLGYEIYHAPTSLYVKSNNIICKNGGLKLGFIISIYICCVLLRYDIGTLVSQVNISCLCELVHLTLYKLYCVQFTSLWRLDIISPSFRSYLFIELAAA